MVQKMKILLFLFLYILAVVPSGYSRKMLIDNFDDTDLVNEFGGSNNSWINSPGDKTIGCMGLFEQEDTGYSLKLCYDVDSSLTYISNSAYILDYSDYSIIGLASKVPHMAFCGYYFLLKKPVMSEYKYLIFYAKGSEEAGYTRRFKIELKTENQVSGYIVEGVTDKWKKFTIPLSVFEKIDDWEDLTEMVIVFNELVTDKKGIIYFDDIYFAGSPDDVYGFQNDDPRIVGGGEE
ncbi:hypothetical protein ACFLUV_02205 [Elusimicrobiota bacterium]